jgi:hypothetical protein
VAARDEKMNENSPILRMIKAKESAGFYTHARGGYIRQNVLFCLMFLQQEATLPGMEQPAGWNRIARYPATTLS